MSTDVVKFAFIAGEISPALYGRSDLTKYDLGMALAQNFFVDYRGGLSSRPGTEFCDFIKHDDQATKFFSFEFSPDLANTYVLLFGDEYVRFIQDGAYVLEDAKAITAATKANPGVITVVGHGYENGRWVKIAGVIGMIELNGKTYEIYDKTTDTFKLKSIPDLTPVNTTAFTTYTSGGTIRAIYELATDYAAEDLVTLNAAQYRNRLRLTSNLYPIFNLTRTDHADWDLVEEIPGVSLAAPTIDSHTVQVAGTANLLFAVTAVAEDGSESERSALYVISNTNNYTVEAGSVAIEWTPVAGAVSYNVYRSIVSSTLPLDGGAELGYAGKSTSNQFVDPNIIPDYGKKPPIDYNPFTDNYPALSCVYQQRQHYFASILKPLTVWGSRPRLFSDFSSSELALDNEAYEFDIDSPSVAPIQHVVLSRGGILLMTQESVWLFNGGSSGQPITPSNVLADPQTYNGVSALNPIPIGSDILFSEGRGYAVRMLAYNEISKVYSGQDQSILSNHLFGPGKTVVSWAYQESPYKVVWGVREDGYLVAFTSVKEQEVFAWTQGQTRGLFKDVINIREGVNDRVYFVVQRYVQGRLTKLIERMALREFTVIEDAWCVDSGLSLTPNYPISTGLYISEEVGGQVILTAGGFDPFDGKVGWIVRAKGGKFKILSETNTSAVAQVLQSVTEFLPETDNVILPSPTGTWTMDEPQTVFGGLDHLEGETVSILGDGNVFPQQVIEDGQVVLPNAVTRVVIGLPFTCIGKTLPMIVANAAIEARRKRIVGVAVRLDRSRGLKIGRTLEERDLYELRERSTEDYGQAIKLIDGVKYQLLSTNWDENGQTYFVQDQPLPVTLLGLCISLPGLGCKVSRVLHKVPRLLCACVNNILSLISTSLIESISSSQCRRAKQANSTCGLCNLSRSYISSRFSIRSNLFKLHSICGSLSISRRNLCVILSHRLFILGV